MGAATGSASATLTIDGIDYTIKGGRCAQSGPIFTVVIGGMSPLMATPKADVFAFNLGYEGFPVASDGTYGWDLMGPPPVGSVAGMQFSFREAGATITLTDGMTAGTFSGTDRVHGAISGLFTC